MLRVEIARLAQRDLETIYDYGAVRFGVAKADDYATELIAAAHLLAEFPELGMAVPGRSDSLRRLSCGAHIILHRTVGTSMLIARVLHARMDLGRHV
jgi:toxin ParE1/3/4